MMCKHGDGNVIKFSCRRKTVALVMLAVVALVSIKIQSIFPSNSAEQRGLTDKSREEVRLIEETKEERGELAMEEPYVNRWDRRFKSSAARGKVGGYVFFKHIRKAGGTSLRRYLRDVFEFHGCSRSESIYEQMMTNQTNFQLRNKCDVNYVEQEFEPLDWQCSIVDPRWQDSLSIAVLRHPVERHMSEFFFSGVNHSTKVKVFGSKKRMIQREQLFLNITYTNTLARFIYDEVPRWMERSRREKDDEAGTLLSRHYKDNFQLRALAGCSSGRWMEKKVAEQSREMKSIYDLHPFNHSYETPNPMCTHFFRENNSLVLDVCSSNRGKRYTECSKGCDGPCSYPTIADGILDTKDVRHAIRSLRAFDVILLMEKLNDKDQSAFLNDVMGVPRNASFALGNTRGMNARVKKFSKREVTHFYRDLLTKLNLQSVLLRLEEENKLEIEFFYRAVNLHDRQMRVWKEETGWGRAG